MEIAHCKVLMSGHNYMRTLCSCNGSRIPGTGVGWVQNEYFGGLVRKLIILGGFFFSFSPATEICSTQGGVQLVITLPCMHCIFANTSPSNTCQKCPFRWPLCFMRQGRLFIKRTSVQKNHWSSSKNHDLEKMLYVSVHCFCTNLNIN